MNHSHNKLANNSNIIFIGCFTPKHSASLATAYQISFLRNAGFTVSYYPLHCFIYHDWEKKLEQILSAHNPILMIFESFTRTRYHIFKIITYVHNKEAQIKLALVGEHVTEMYQQIINKYPYIIAVIGEAERTLPELALAIHNKNTFHTIKGLAFTQKNISIRTKPRELLSLRKLPRPQYDLLISPDKKEIILQTSRGCTHSCSFCGTNTLNKRKTRFRPILEIIHELKHIAQKYPSIKTINFYDENFFASAKRVEVLCNEIIKSKLPFKYACSGRFDTISERIVKLLERAQFVDIGLGLESANEQILKKAKKNITTEKALKVVHYFQKTKIKIRIMLIIGLPGETWKTIKQTGLFIQQLQRKKYIFYFNNSVDRARVLPNTKLYYTMYNAKMISTDIWLNGPEKPVFTLEHSEEELLRMRKELLTYISIDFFFSIKGFIRQLPIILGSSEAHRILSFLVNRKINGFKNRILRKLL